LQDYARTWKYTGDADVELEVSDASAILVTCYSRASLRNFVIYYSCWLCEQFNYTRANLGSLERSNTKSF
jgi:hypothetical protein